MSNGFCLEENVLIVIQARLSKNRWLSVELSAKTSVFFF